MKVRVIMPFAVEDGPTHPLGAELDLQAELAARLQLAGYVEPLAPQPEAELAARPAPRRKAAR